VASPARVASMADSEASVVSNSPSSSNSSKVWAARVVTDHTAPMLSASTVDMAPSAAAGARATAPTKT
jgi:hypothetical protein